jgi:predicted enzyme related to lactoylglutathione lyase
MVHRDTPWTPGTPCWVDLMTTDPRAAQDFYRELFGWQIDVGGEETGFYAMCSVGGRAAAGIGPMMGAGDDHPPVWSTYLATSDVEATTATALQAGATVVAPVIDVMDFGRMSFVQLESGGVVGFWQAGTTIGVEIANEPGTLTWNEFLTRDYEGAKDFYAAVFGYGYTEIGNANFRYSMIAIEGDTTVGGIGELPADVPASVPPHWRAYFSVVDTDETVARAEQLGGSVLRPARDMPFGRWADLADPQGAMFSVVRPPTGG